MRKRAFGRADGVKGRGAFLGGQGVRQLALSEPRLARKDGRGPPQLQLKFLVVA